MLTNRSTIYAAALGLLIFLSQSSWAGTIVRLSTTKGDIDIELNEQKAPLTVANFLRLVDEGFYDGLIFHRVLANFVIQAGGYEVSMDYREPPGTVPNESDNGLSNEKGSIAMARLTDPDSADAQFFINVVNNERLDASEESPGYTVFGRVVDGWQTVEDIELSDVEMKLGMAGVPVEPIVIVRAARL